MSNFKIQGAKCLPHTTTPMIADGMSTVTAISQTLVHITVAEHQYPSKVLIPNCISRALFERNSIKWFQLSII